MKPFTDTINALRFGTLSDELTKKLNEITQACAIDRRAVARSDRARHRVQDHQRVGGVT